jgi:hypothetical protein
MSRPKKTEQTKALLVKLPENLYRELKLYCYENGWTMTETVTELITRELDQKGD